MPSVRDWRILGGAGGVSGLALAGVAMQRRHTKLIAADPEQAVLSTPPEGHPLSVPSADGTALHVEVFGPPDGATIILAHGWTETLSYWIYVTRELTARGFRVVAYDLRGHGKSKPAAGGDYSLARLGEDLEAVLDSCVSGPRRAVVAGHSLGAMSLVAWAENHEVGRLVGAAALLNTGVGDLIAEQLLFPLPAIARAVNKTFAVRGFLGVRTPLPRVSTPLSYAAIRYIAFGPVASPAQVAFYERMLVSCPPNVRADVGIAMSNMELYHALPRLTVPTLVIAGADDRLTPPSHARRIAGMLPSLTALVELPETGHMAPLERPREVSEALVELSSVVAHSDTVAACSDGTTGEHPAAMVAPALD